MHPEYIRLINKYKLCRDNMHKGYSRKSKKAKTATKWSHARFKWHMKLCAYENKHGLHTIIIS